MELNNNINVSIYSELLAHLDDSAKLALIAHLSSATGSEKKRKPVLFKRLFGAWKSEESAEEIIKSIRKSRKSNRKIEPL